MRTFKYYATILVLAGVLLSGFVFGIDKNQGIQDRERTLRKPLVLSALNFDGNRVDDDLMNNGMIVSHLVSGRSGMSWPKGNGTQTVYASGVWLGAKVDGQVRVSAGEYSGELSGGPWGSDPNDPAHKLYKVSKSDWDDPAASDDFQNWPAHQGAPFIDVNENGTYEPLPGGPDYPDFPGAQVIWAVMNDGDPTAHAVFQTPPLGIEVQMTIFGFDRPDAFGDMMFVKELIINAGDNTLKDMIVGLWSDPDLGDAADDFVGCDTTLGMGICYNAGDDVNFAGYVGGTPAVGYDFFQGPMVPADGESAFMFGRHIPNMKNLKMGSFTKYINSDPVYYDPNNAIEAYNYMSGFMPDGSDFPFIASGGTKFVHPGDPNLDTGPDDTEYVDSDLHPPDDRRFLMNAGPFTMAPGDSQEVVFAIIHAAGGEALKSYNLLKVVDAQAQFAYDNNFVLPNAPDKPEFEATVLHDEIILTWNHESENYSVPGPDTPTGETTTFEFEGYNVYQYETANGDNPTRIATYDVINNVTQIKDQVFVNSLAELVETTVQDGSDSGLQRQHNITADANSQNSALIPQRAYYFAVTAFSYNEYGSPKVLESSPDIITVRPQASQNWMATDETAAYGTVLAAEHPEGPSDGVAQAVVVDPTLLTGADYELFFAEETYYLDIDGVWKNVNAAGKERLEKILDCSGSMITVSAVASEIVGTYDLMFDFVMSCGSNWVDGIVLDFADGVKINSWGGVGDFSYGTAGGQNCENMDGTLDAATNAITWGSDARSGFGCIEGDTHWMVNINPESFPIDIAYTVYDDTYDGTLVDADGTASATELGYAHKTVEGWYARNLTSGEIVTPHTTIQSGVAIDNIVDGVFVPGYAAGTDAGPIADGLQFAVDGPELGVNRVSETDQDDVVLDGNVGVYPPSLGTTGYILSHRDHGTGSGRTHDRFGLWVMDDVIINYGEESLAWDYISEEVNGTVPYSIYRKKFPSGELVQLFAGYWESDGIEGYTNDGGTWVEAAYGVPCYEPIYAWQGYDAAGNEINYDPANDAQYIADNALLTSANITWGGGTGEFHYPFVTATFLATYLDGSTPPWGNKIWIITNKANTSQDKFTISTADIVGASNSFDSDDISVWPNPYFGFNPEERDPVDNQMHFINLPMDEDCTIRIFDLTGVPVSTIEHDAGSTLEVWDLKNDSNIPVASGMYIAVIETKDGTKILKIAIIQPEQRLDLYG